MRLSRRALVGTASATVLAAPFVLRQAALGADPIKVVGIHDASGGLDIYGRPMIDCLTLATEEINAKGGLLGREIQLTHYDPQSNIQLYTQFATQAATKDRAAVVLGGITSASREAIRPVLRRYSTLYFYNTQYEGGVCDRNIFCLGSGPAQNVAKLVPNVMGQWGKKVYILAADYNYGQITSKWVTKYVREGGGEVVAADFFPLDVTDFGPTIKKIQAAKPDMVMSVLVGGAHISFYRQWAAADMKQATPMASTTFGVGNEHVVLTPEEGDGITVAFAYFQELATPANQAFVKTYKERFGDKASNVTELAMQTYVGMKVWAEGVTRAGTTDRMKVIEALEQGLSHAGPGGTVTLDPKTHHAFLDVHVAEAKNRAFNVLETFPQQPPADTQSVCDLVANPNSNQQFVIDVKI
jgi:branched-chain amino acid transport system substrate-binding protein